MSVRSQTFGSKIAVALLAMALWHGAASPALAQLKLPVAPQVPKPNEYTPEMLQKHFRTEANAYNINVKAKNRQLKLVDEPLLNWQNTERLLEQGLMFLWKDGERPAVLISIFTYQWDGRVYRRHEVISLIPEALEARFEGDLVWQPSAADTKGFPVLEGSNAESTAPRRLTQMRNIMREVSGKHTPYQQSTAQDLRLMTQPLLRYQVDSAGIVDGAIFSLAVGTDPEILVALEARKVEDSVRWFLVPFRSHYEVLELSYQGKPIWSTTEMRDLAFTSPMQMPYAGQPFFAFTPTKSLPVPEMMK